MSETPETIAGDLFQTIDGDLTGLSLEETLSAASDLAEKALTSGLLGFSLNPFKAAERLAKGAGRFAGNVATLPVRMSLNVAKGAGQGIYHGILPSGGGGRRGPAPARGFARRRPAGGGGGGGEDGGGGGGDDGGGGDGGGEEAAADDSSTEGRLLGMLQSPGGASRISYLEGKYPGFTRALAGRLSGGGHHGKHHHKHKHEDVAGFSLRNLLHRTTPAGKLLVSAAPGGTTALQAHGIATKALKSGALKPAHLKAAAALTKAGRAGDDKALVKIAAVKAKAQAGDPAAVVALDRLKLAHSLQTGQPTKGGGGKLSQSYSHGLAVLARRHA